jgi:PAS domain S-box-containing protein
MGAHNGTGDDRRLSAGGPLAADALAEALVESNVDGLAVVDPEMRYLLWNRAMERCSGKRADEVLGRNALDVFPFLRERGLDALIRRALAGETVTVAAVPTDQPDGVLRYFDRVYQPLRDADGTIVAAIGIVRDATSRRATEEALHASEAQLCLAASGAGVGLWTYDVRTGAIRWEPALCKIFGVSPDAAPRTREEFFTLVHPDDRAATVERVRRAVAENAGWDLEYRILRGDGAVRWVLAKGAVVDHCIVGAVIDVTERRERDEQLRQAQKLEAIGQLTAGVAHNFNNMLMCILPNLKRAVRIAPAELQPMLHDARDSARRAADLIAQLMTYAGRNAPCIRVVESMSALVERSVALCRTTFDQRIAFETAYDASAHARVEPVQLEQALLNVLINARDAVAHVRAPTLTVRVDVVPPAAPELGGRAGEFVRVRVHDDGMGMDAVTASRAFEPFFTTKPAGKGTGLGLATTRATLVEHGGFVTCDSALGRGTTFSIYLPRAAAELDEPGFACAAVGAQAE